MVKGKEPKRGIRRMVTVLGGGTFLWLALTNGGQAADVASSLATRVGSQANGVTLTLDFDLAQLRYEAEGQGALNLPGLSTRKTPGGWAIPEKTFDVVLPVQTHLTRCEVQVEGLVQAPIQIPLLRLTFPSRECEEGSAGRPVPANYPDERVSIGTEGYYHGIHFLPLTVTPVQVETATGQVWGASRIIVTLEWAGNTAGVQVVQPSVKNQEAQKFRTALLKGAANAFQMQNAYNAAATVASESPATYVPRTPTGTVVGVIIAPENLVKYYQLIAEDKTRSGQPWEVVTYEWIYAQPAYQQGSFTDEPARIRHFLQETYQRYGLEFVLFGGKPPYMPATWDRASYGSGSEARSLRPHRSLGYYTNLDGGEHTDLAVHWEMRFAVVKMFSATQYSLQTSTWVTRPTANFATASRCGYLSYYDGSRSRDGKHYGFMDVLPTGTSSNLPLGLVMNTLFGYVEPRLWMEVVTAPEMANGFIRGLAQRRPDLWNQWMLYAQEGRVNFADTCDMYPELVAGWLPPDPNLGGVGVGLYHSKIRNYREPQDPDMVGAVPGDDILMNGVHSILGTVMNCMNGPFLPNFFVDSLQRALQPMGLLAVYGCDWRSWGNAVAGPYWLETMTPLMLYPDGGPVVTAHDGMGAFGGYHEGPGARYDVGDGLLARMPLGRLALWADAGDRSYIAIAGPDWNSWRSGHQGMVYGDPSLLPFVSNQFIRPMVAHPQTAQSSFDVTVLFPNGSPIAGALVVASKRRPDGSYSTYHRQSTDAQGIARFDIGPIEALGNGVVNVEVDRFPDFPDREFYPYHGAMLLAVNHPPVVIPNVPTVAPLTTREGSWVILDAGETVDPDGDPVTVTWSWQDNRTGNLASRQMTGRYVRAFLPAGTNLVAMSASDGQAAIHHTMALEMKDLTPPVINAAPLTLTHWQKWVTVPIRLRNFLVSGYTGELNFSAWDDISAISEWSVTAVTSNDPRQPAPVTFTLLPSRELVVYAEDNTDGTPRKYTVTIKVWNTSGNFALGVGEVTVAPPAPAVYGYPQKAVTQTNGWVFVPIVINNSANPYVLNFPVVETRGISGWRVTDVREADPRVPSPVSFTFLPPDGLWVLAEGNEDCTTRRYLVSMEVWNTLGLTATATGEIGVISPDWISRRPYLVRGRVGQGLQNGGEFSIPPVITVPDPDTVIQFVSPDGSSIVRARVDVNGEWTAWLPLYENWRFQATRGGRNFFVYDSYDFQIFKDLAPPGVGQYTWVYELYPTNGKIVSRPRLSGNQSPVVSCRFSGGTSFNPLVSLNAGSSSDPDGDLLTYEWRWTFNGVSYVRKGPVIKDLTFSVGDTPVSLTVSDGAASSTTTLMVSVAGKNSRSVGQ